MVSPFRELTEAAFWVIEREVAASEALSRRALAVGRPGDSAARPLRGTARRGRRRRGAIPGILQPAGQCRVAVDLALAAELATGRVPSVRAAGTGPAWPPSPPDNSRRAARTSVATPDAPPGTSGLFVTRRDALTETARKRSACVPRGGQYWADGGAQIGSFMGSSLNSCALQPGHRPALEARGRRAATSACGTWSVVVKRGGGTGVRRAKPEPQEQ
jgi:hypothetical protein